MFKDISGQECSLTAGQIQEASGRFVKDYVSQLAFHLLCELFILLGKLDRIFWVIFKLNLLFVLFKIFAWAKCVSKTLISLLLPAFSGAVKRLSVFNGLANGEHIPLSTFAIMSNFCLAFDIRTAAARVAGSLASVLTSFELLHASLSTTFFHLFLTQFIICWIFEALAFRMTDFLANVATSKRKSALLSTIWSLSVTIHLLLGLLAAIANLRNRLQTWWTRAKMASQRAFVPTL